MMKFGYKVEQSRTHRLYKMCTVALFLKAQDRNPHSNTEPESRLSLNPAKDGLKVKENIVMQSVYR